MGWASNAYIGITASTGQLADNHDVISLVTYSDSTAMVQAQEALSAKKRFEVDPNMPIDQRVARYVGGTLKRFFITDISLFTSLPFFLRVFIVFSLISLRIEGVVDEMLGRLEHLDLHVEHELAAVSDKLGNLLAKLEKREDKAEQRIDSLELVRSSFETVKKVKIKRFFSFSWIFFFHSYNLSSLSTEYFRVL